MSPPKVDSDLVRALAALLDETRLTEIEYEADGLRIRVARGVAPAPVAAVVAAPVLPADPGREPGAVLSPLVGVVYLSPEPGTPPFFKPGDQVVEGQTLLLIEAMKTFNAIRAPQAGKVLRLLVTDGQPVEYGEPLLVLG